MTSSIAPSVEELCHRITALNPRSVDRPVLVYFDIIGIAWPIRCALHLKSVDYDLIQISIDQWAYRDDHGVQPVKRCFKNGHVPLYVDAETALNQSTVIMRYLAENLGLGGKTAEQRNGVMEIMSHAYDALFHWNGLLQIIVSMGVPEDVVVARRNAFMGEGFWGLATNGYANHLDAFGNYLRGNPCNSGYFVGETLTIADLHAFNVLCNWYKAFAPERFVTDYPQLDDFVQRIGAIPAVREYIENLQEPTTWFPRPDLAIRLTSAEELAGLVG